eukprot:GILJ01001564.1.p1 GENE.GILJ01001564.1~~GILJ01001564.1.p1  ORF type:complete len:390 (+),score=25.80 GILJ01001564.1:73-1242(+)
MGQVCSCLCLKSEHDDSWAASGPQEIDYVKLPAVATHKSVSPVGHGNKQLADIQVMDIKNSPSIVSPLRFPSPSSPIPSVTLSCNTKETSLLSLPARSPFSAHSVSSAMFFTPPSSYSEMDLLDARSDDAAEYPLAEPSPAAGGVWGTSLQGEDIFIREECIRQWDAMTDRAIETLITLVKDVDPSKLVYNDGKVKVYKEDRGSTHVLRAEYEVSYTPVEFVTYARDIRRRFDWDTNMKRVEVIARIGGDMDLVYQQFKRILTVSPRDLLLVRKWKHYPDDTSICVNVSVSHEGIPEQSGKVRAEIPLAGYLVFPTFSQSALPRTLNTSFPQCPASAPINGARVIFFTHMNPKGWIPSSIVNAVAVREVPKVAKKLVSAMDKHLSHLRR